MSGVQPDFETPNPAPTSGSAAQIPPPHPTKQMPAKANKSRQKPKPKSKTARPQSKLVKPSKMELDSDDEERLSLREHIREIEARYNELQQRYTLQNEENDALLRDNEILQKELNESAGRSRNFTDPDAELSHDDDGDVPILTAGGRPLTAGGAEGMEYFQELERKREAAAAAVCAQRLRQSEDHSQILQSVRARRKKLTRKSPDSPLHYGEALVRAAKSTQLHVKLGTPGVPLNERQVIAVCNRGDAPGLAHLAVLVLARDLADAGIQLSKTVANDNPELALEIVTAHLRESDNMLCLLHRGLSENVLFDDVAEVPEYQFLVEECGRTGRGVNDLLCDASIERMLQIVRSTAKQTHQTIDFPPPQPMDKEGKILPQQNEVLFAALQPSNSTSSGGYGPHTQSEPGKVDTVKYCDFFQKKKGCNRGSKCRFVSGHICAQCGSRNHGAWKHASRSRYAPYKK